MTNSKGFCSRRPHLINSSPTVAPNAPASHASASPCPGCCHFGFRPTGSQYHHRFAVLGPIAVGQWSFFPVLPRTARPIRYHTRPVPVMLRCCSAYMAHVLFLICRIFQQCRAAHREWFSSISSSSTVYIYYRWSPSISPSFWFISPTTSFSWYKYLPNNFFYLPIFINSSLLIYQWADCH